MKKYLLIPFFFIIISTAFSQDLFFIGTRSYPSTGNFTLKSNSNSKGSDLEVIIAKNGNDGLLVLSAESSTEVLIKGNAIVYLDDGAVISCIDKGKYDHVDNNAITVYNLTRTEIEKMLKSNINTIRYSLKFNGNGYSTEEGNFSATNKSDGHIINGHFMGHQKVNVPELLQILFE